MKKGFTLIELLAVILILGIIALIAVPQVTNVIEDSKEKATLQSIRGYIKSAEEFYIQSKFDQAKEDKLGTNIIDELEVNGEALEGSIVVSTTGEVEAAITKNDKCYKKTKDDNISDIEVYDGTTCDVVDLPPEIVTLSREQILNAKTSDYSYNTVLKYENYYKFSRDTYDVGIPVTKLNDPVYLSMAMPSETMSDYTIEQRRDNAHIIGNVSGEEGQKVLAIGALYKTTGATIPDEFYVYFGKIKLFAYSKSQQKWIVINEKKHLAKSAVYIYTLPWTSTKSYKLTDVEETEDYLKVRVSGEMFGNNVIHFWAQSVPVDKEDYLYYATAYEFWVSDNVVGKLTANIGIDTKTESGATDVQLFSSRGLSAQAYPRTHWGHTVPSDQYDNVNTKSLNNLF